MSVRRGATRLATVGTLLGVMLLLVAAPAAADEDSVRVRAPSGFTAGGSPGSATVTVTRRTAGCVNLRTALGVRLPGLTADRVEVQVAADGRWRPVAVSGDGAGLVVAQRTAPAKPVLCARKSVSVRYRISFLAGAPNGRATVVAEAYTAAGAVIGRDSDTARVAGRKGVDPSPTQPVPELVLPTPTPEETEEPAAPVQEVATGGPGPASAAASTDGSFGIGTLVMVVGIALVGIGAALLVLLLRRGRGERPGPESGGAGPPGWGPPGPPPRPAGGGGAAGGGDPTLILPGTAPTQPPPSDATLILPRTPPRQP